MTLLSSHVTCFVKFIGLCDFLVKLHMIADFFLISGQYVHLPNLVQVGTYCEVDVFSWGGYTVVELVSISLKFGSLQNPIIGSVVKIGPQSGQLEIMFQFLWIISLILGFEGL